VKIRFGTVGCPLYCDVGPNAGDMLIDLSIGLYLSPQEYASYQGPESLQITLNETADGHLRTRSTAGPAGELPPAGAVAISVAAPATASAPDHDPDMTGTRRTIERAITETAARPPGRGPKAGRNVPR
jgi:hypothetical protein